MKDVSGDAFLRLNSYLHQPGNFDLLSLADSAGFCRLSFLGGGGGGGRAPSAVATPRSCCNNDKPGSVPPRGIASQLQCLGSVRPRSSPTILSRLERIANDLPNSYQSLLSKLRSEVPSLLAHGYPIVICHWDLLENNMHMDAQTGQITGIHRRLARRQSRPLCRAVLGAGEYLGDPEVDPHGLPPTARRAPPAVLADALWGDSMGPCLTLL